LHSYSPLHSHLHLHTLTRTFTFFPHTLHLSRAAYTQRLHIHSPSHSLSILSPSHSRPSALHTISAQSHLSILGFDLAHLFFAMSFTLTFTLMHSHVHSHSDLHSHLHFTLSPSHSASLSSIHPAPAAANPALSHHHVRLHVQQLHTLLAHSHPHTLGFAVTFPLNSSQETFSPSFHPSFSISPSFSFSPSFSPAPLHSHLPLHAPTFTLCIFKLTYNIYNLYTQHLYTFSHSLTRTHFHHTQISVH
jgi:hypothetical protein